MSDHTVAEPEVLEYNVIAAPEGGPDFQGDELSHFDDEDTVAGSAIGKLLCFFFLYTIIAMSLVGYWTWSSVAAR